VRGSPALDNRGNYGREISNNPESGIATGCAKCEGSVPGWN